MVFPVLGYVDVHKLSGIAPQSSSLRYFADNCAPEFRGRFGTDGPVEVYGHRIGVETAAGSVDNVKITTELSRPILMSLLEGQCSAVRVPNFCSKEIAQILAQEIIRSSDRQNYQHEIKNDDGTITYLDYSVDRVGPVRNKLFGSGTTLEQWQEYSRIGHRQMDHFRSLCMPYGEYPIDVILNKLNNGFPHGAQLDEVAQGVQAYAGVGRITRPGLKTRLSEEPHKDSLPPGLAYPVQLGINIYLDTPAAGGELVIWDEINGKPEGKLWELRPEIGDLVMVATNRFHSVNGFEKSQRVTISCFGGLKEDHPIKLWS